MIDGSITKEEEDWVEDSLKEVERNKSTRRILGFESFAAVGKGDNYTSDLYRVRVKIQQVDGEVTEKALIFKTLPRTELRKKYMKASGIFITEIRMYKEVLPLMEKIRLEKEISEPLWSECYGAKGYESILFEDLSVKGYKMGERRKGLDFEHCQIVMEGLSKIHSLSVVLHERGDLNSWDYEKHFIEKMDMVEHFYGCAFKELAKLIDTWDEEWAGYGVAIRKLSETLKDDLIDCFRYDKHSFNVLNHGDCWVNNFLFKYDSNGKPVSMRFVDFQLPRYSSPGFDLQYFLNSSTLYDIRPRHGELIKIYYDCLVSDLQLFGYSGVVPTMEDLELGLNKAALFGLVTAVALLPMMKLQADDVPDVEAILKKVGNCDDLNKSLENEDIDWHYMKNGGDDYKIAIQATLTDFKDKGILRV